MHSEKGSKTVTTACGEESSLSLLVVPQPTQEILGNLECEASVSDRNSIKWRTKIRIGLEADLKAEHR